MMNDKSVAARAKGSKDEMNGGEDNHRHLYDAVFELLRVRIADGRLPDGARLKEGPIATILNVSRAPVRRALVMLADERLVCAADGQGYIVGDKPTAPVFRLKDLDLVLKPGGAFDVGRGATATPVITALREEIAACLPFGTYRLLEARISDHFGVSRTIVREVLIRLLDQGLIEKDTKSHWIAGPLTARSTREALELRRLLAPSALTSGAHVLDRAHLEKLAEQARSFLAAPETATPARVDDLEHFMHRNLLQNGTNTRVTAVLGQNLTPFVICRAFRGRFGTQSDQRLLADYVRVLDLLISGSFEAASTELSRHLDGLTDQMLRKLRVLSVLPAPETAPYLAMVH